MKCTKCGEEMLEGASFCRFCGSKAERISSTNYCPDCGFQLVPGAKFCQKCGRPICCEESKLADYNVAETDDDDGVPTKRGLSLFKKLTDLWNGFDGVTHGCIISSGFFLYLLILSRAAHNGFATAICILQFILLAILVASHYKVIKTQRNISPLIIAAIVLLGALYVDCYHVKTPSETIDNTVPPESTTQSDTTPDAQFYTSNTAESCMNGNSGLYSYAIELENYYMYFIFDFEDECIYCFMDDSKDSGICIEFPIESGDLNSGIPFTTYMNDAYTEVTAHFAEKNQPQKLIVQDQSDGSMTLYPTNLENALRIKEKKSVITMEDIQESETLTPTETDATIPEVLADNQVKIDFTPYSLVGKNFKTVGEELEQEGFTDINYEIAYDIVWGITEEGSVKNLTIAGRSDFSKGDIFLKSDPIVITYHMMQKDDPNRPTETTSPETETSLQETQRATEDKSVYYTTNTTDTYKNGNSGIYAYKSIGGKYDNYWIIDFDEGYVYSFTEGLGDNSCSKVAIESGDLNSTLVFSYHLDGTAYQYSAFFKWKRSPNHLVVVDDDDFDYDYYPTDLSDALQLKKQKTVTLY